MKCFPSIAIKYVSIFAGLSLFNSFYNLLMYPQILILSQNIKEHFVVNNTIV